MSEVLVRNLNRKTIEVLKRRAAGHHRSLQQELKVVLEEASRWESLDAESAARRIRANLSKKRIRYSDSGEFQAEDRLR